jgi:hypothetical protein
MFRPRPLDLNWQPLWIAAVVVMAGQASAGEQPCGQGMSDANKEYRVLDDMADVSRWYNGSPDETRLSIDDQRVREGKHSLRFANKVDHTKGEKNYPVGWPRTGRNLGKQEPSDWSGYDFFECWIYTETSRATLPGTPLGLGIRHPGHKRSSDFRLSEVTKDAWVKIAIPVAKLLDPADVRSIQFHIAEANYKHGDQVDFLIGPITLARFVNPAVAELSVDRKILYTSDRSVTAAYRLVGYKAMASTGVEFEVGRDATVIGKAVAPAARGPGELPLTLSTPPAPGDYWARLSLRDSSGKLIDRKETGLRVIAGPFSEFPVDRATGRR